MISHAPEAVNLVRSGSIPPGRPDRTTRPRFFHLSPNQFWLAGMVIVLGACGGSPTETVAVASVSVSPSATTLAPGTTTQLTATALDAAGGSLPGRTITWSSSNIAVATVSPSGLVTGVAPGGPVTVTASSEGRTGTVEVSVIAPGVNLSGLWYHDRVGSNFNPNLKGTIVLARSQACDGDGYTCYTGVPLLNTPQGEQSQWSFGVKGNEIVVCLGNCGVLACVGTISASEQSMTAQCVFINLVVGTFTASRTPN